MNKRDNLISLYRRQGYSDVPVEFNLCPSLYETFKERTGRTDYAEYFGFSSRTVDDLRLPDVDTEKFRSYYDYELLPGTTFDVWGVAYEPGSEASKHMTRMRHPLANIDSLSRLEEYPFPDYSMASGEHQKKQVEDIHAMGLAAVGGMECTIWETSWYMRSMEELMMDMMMEDEKAEYLLDRVTEAACIRGTTAYARSGVDIIKLGDDIGMQKTIMMSKEMYRTWLKPRLKKVIDAIRKEKQDVIIIYHSCGYVKPFINDLIDAGIDVLNPVQPECMDFKEIHEEFGNRLSFNGTIGTQTIMPFGTPEEIRDTVYKNLEIAGDKGGLCCTPTHMLEPEVPWENILAYVDACKSFRK
ncbi:MAG TPA: hypothetical protein DD426_12515 [Clostridiaceae bacterium]|nr:hypothetical protein [Clostridiaceae bacterium]